MSESTTIRFPIFTVRGTLCVERRAFEAKLGTEGTLKYVAEITGLGDEFRYERRFLNRVKDRTSEESHFAVTALRKSSIIELGSVDKHKIYFVVEEVRHDSLLVRPLSSADVDMLIASKRRTKHPVTPLSDDLRHTMPREDADPVFSGWKDGTSKEDAEEAADPEPPDHPAIDEGVDSTTIATADTVESFRDLFKGGS
jgi:hypothetical protein